jgi:hypothetical protein
MIGARRMLGYRNHVALWVLLSCLFVVALAFSACEDDGPTSAGCSDCGSGDVYWDSNVARCRDDNTGRFVKSCCCGH